MSNYNRSIDFTAKDALSTGDPSKVIKGSEMDSELDLIGAASSTKANKIVPAAVGNVPKLSGTGDLEDSAVTLTELQILDGATISTAELNTLDGITASAAELNVLDGIPGTLTATELGYVDGVTSSVQDQIDSALDGTGIAAEAIVTASLEADERMTTTNVLTKTAAASVGDVGSYAFLGENGTLARAAGATLAGSVLQYASMQGSGTYGAFSHIGATPSGTWRLMGEKVGGSGTAPGVSVWLRIS